MKSAIAKITATTRYVVSLNSSQFRVLGMAMTHARLGLATKANTVQLRAPVI